MTIPTIAATCRVEESHRTLGSYHLRFGVRTINEVRASRGLAPVAWGDKPI